MDYRTATKKIALALRKSGVFVSVRLGRDSGNPRRGQEVLVQVSRGEVSQVQTFFEAVTKILKPVGFKPLGWGSGKVWKDIDDTIWVDAEDGYHLKAEEVKTFAIQVREKIIPLNQRKGHLREALQRIANDVPSSRVHLLPILRKHACGCDDGVVAGDLDEMFAGRAYTTPNGPDGAENKKDFGTAPSMGGPGKWKGKKKDKCFYETGDEADRCYVTTNGGPGGQKKPSSGGAGADGSGKRQEYNQKYKKQRWNKGAAERLAELRAKKAGSGAANAKYLDRLSAPAKAKIMKAVARHYGVSIRVMDAELRDPEAEDLYEYLAFDNTMAMQVYRGFKSLRLASRLAELRSQKRAAWSPPKINKALARAVAKRADKNWAQIGVTSLKSIRDALSGTIVSDMNMSDRVDYSGAVTAWKAKISDADLRKIFRWIEEIKNGKSKRQYRMTDEALARLK